MAESPRTRTLTFRDALRAVARHRILFVSIVLLFLVCTYWTSRRAPKEYRASALLVVEAPRRNLLDPANLIEVVQPDLPRYYQTQYELLGSERLVGEVLENDAELALRLQALPEYAPSSSWLHAFLPESETSIDPAEKHVAFVQALRERIEVEPREESYLVDVVFHGTDPELTTRFVNALAEQFAARHARNDTETRESSAELLGNKVKKLEEQWMSSRQALVDFQKDHEVLGFEERQRVLGADYERLVAARTQLELEIAAESPRLEGLRAGNHRNANAELLPAAIALIGENEALVELRRELRQVEASLEGKGGQDLGVHHREILELTAKRDVLLQSLRAAEDLFVEGRIARLDQRLREHESVLELTKLRKDELEELTSLRQRYEELSTRSADALSVYQQYARREAELAMGPTEEGKAPQFAANIYVEAFARIPSRPFKPRIVLNLLLAFLIGMASAISVVLLREQWDDRIRSRADLERVHAGRPLGLVPSYRKRGGAADRAVLDDPSGVFAEAYRDITASLIPDPGAEDGHRSFVVTSSSPSEGKTTTAVNLAAVLACDGARVLLVEGDLRRPRLHRALELEPGPGLTEVFRSTVALEDAIRETRLPGLSLLPCGEERLEHPSELLSSAWMRTFLQSLQSRWDVVIVDTPPVNLVTDAFALARQVDGTVVVARADQTRGKALELALEKLAQLEVPLMGIVLNGVKARGEGYYGYGRRYAYQAPLRARRPAKARPARKVEAREGRTNGRTPRTPAAL